MSFNKIFELNDNELNMIEEHLRQKLIKNGENFISQHDSLKIDYEKFKIECEQRFIELESEFNECQSKLVVESEKAHLYKIKSDENDEKLSTHAKQISLLQNEKETYYSNQQRLSTVNQNLEADKRELHIILDKKIRILPKKV